MNKLLSVLLALMLVFALAACGGDVAEESGEDTAQSQAPEAEAEDEAEAEAPPPAPVGGTTVSMSTFDITMFDPWQHDSQYDSDGEGYSSTSFFVPGEREGDDLIELSIEIEEGDAADYRYELRYAEVDLYEFVENSAGERMDIGGVSCVIGEYEMWDEITRNYIGRDEASGMNILISVDGEYDDPIVAQMLGTIVLKLNDQGLVDPPWFWQGEPMVQPETLSAPVGGFTLTAEQVLFDESVEAYDVFSARIVAGADDAAWLSINDMLYEYTLGESLSLVSEFDLGEWSIAEMSADTAGNIYTSDHASSLLKIAPEGEAITYEHEGYTAMHPSGEWGLSYFVSNPVSKVTLSADSFTVEEDFIPKDEAFMINDVWVAQDYVFVGGVTTEGSKGRLMVYDTSGALLYTLGGDSLGEDDDVIGSLTDVIQTQNGFMALDGNLRNLLFWDLSGNFVGVIDQSELFGEVVDYPWLCDLAQLSDGSVLTILTQERDDTSGDELLAFRVSGF